MGPHDMETFRHQMSTYLSNALTGSVSGINPNNDRQQISVPPPQYLPFLMGHIDEKVLTRLPTPATHPNLGLLYHHHHHHPTQSSNINISSASPTSSSSSNSSTSDIHEQTSSYLTTFDHHRRLKLEIQDATA
jgi:hypothetical protein